MVSQTALPNDDVDSLGCDEATSLGNHIAASQARNAQVATSSVTTITQDQLPAGYVCNKARRMKEIVIGTRFR